MRLDQPAEHYVTRIAAAVEQAEDRRAAIRAAVAAARRQSRCEVPEHLGTLAQGRGARRRDRQEMMA